MKGLVLVACALGCALSACGEVAVQTPMQGEGSVAGDDGDGRGDGRGEPAGDGDADARRPTPTGATPGGGNLDDVTGGNGSAGAPAADANVGEGVNVNEGGNEGVDGPPTPGDVMQAPPAEPDGPLCSGVPTDVQRHSSHCGACDARCEPVVVATGPRWPVAIAMNDTHVYWMTGGNEGALMRVALGGGAAEMLAPGQSFPHAIALDATHVYWASNSRIKRLPLDGGGAPTDLVGRQINAQGIALDATRVYWTDQAASGPGSIRAVPLAGGEPITLVDDAGPSPYAIAVDARHIYWAEASAGDERAVLRAPLAGGAAETLARGPYPVHGMAIDAEHIYWTSFLLSSSVHRAALDGTGEITLAGGTLQPQGVAVDRHGAYWVNSSNAYTLLGQPGTDGSAMAVSLDGGDAAPLALGQADPAGIATNGHTVCWANYGNATVTCLGLCEAGSCE